MSIANISLRQALDVWSELLEAEMGVNGYGSDTTEIYAFRLMPYDPRAVAGIRNDSNQDKINAGQALYDLLLMFQSQRDVVIHVDGRPLSRDNPFAGPFTHRCHVRVTQRTVQLRAEQDPAPRSVQSAASIETHPDQPAGGKVKRWIRKNWLALAVGVGCSVMYSLLLAPYNVPLQIKIAAVVFAMVMGWAFAEMEP